MPRFNFDDTVPNMPGDTVPDDTYDADIVAVIPGVTQKGAKWDVFSDIVAGEQKGKRIKDTWFWYGGGPGRIMVVLQHLGVEILEGDANYPVECILGMPIRLEVQNTEKEYKGEMQSECKPRWDGYRRDDSREWVKVEREPEQPKKDAQGSVFDAEGVPF